MAKVRMTCGETGTSWTLELSDESVAVVNEENETEILFSTDEAFRRIHFTGSWDDATSLLILGDDSREYDFQLERNKVPFVKAFVEAAIARDPERAMRHFRTQAARSLWIAVLGLLAGLFGGLLTWAFAPDRWPFYFVSASLVIPGLAYLHWGLQSRARARRIARTVKSLPTNATTGTEGWSPWLVVLLAIGLAGNLVGLAVVLLQHFSARE
jgi:hypothetical protein